MCVCVDVCAYELMIHAVDDNYDGIHNVEQYRIPNQVLSNDGNSYLLLTSHPIQNRIAFHVNLHHVHLLIVHFRYRLNRIFLLISPGKK